MRSAMLVHLVQRRAVLNKTADCNDSVRSSWVLLVWKQKSVLKQCSNSFTTEFYWYLSNILQTLLFFSGEANVQNQAVIFIPLGVCNVRHVPQVYNETSRFKAMKTARLYMHDQLNHYCDVRHFYRTCFQLFARQLT